MSDYFSNNDLHRAVYCGDIDTLKTLLEQGVSPNSCTMQGNSLFCSVLLGKAKKQVKLKCLELLIKYGGDINTVNNQGDSILHLAVKVSTRQKISLDVIEKLLRLGAKNMLKNSTGLTPVQLAFQEHNARLGSILFFQPLKMVESAREQKQSTFKPDNSRAVVVSRRETSFLTRTLSMSREKLLKFMNPFLFTVNYNFSPVRRSASMRLQATYATNEIKMIRHRNLNEPITLEKAGVVGEDGLQWDGLETYECVNKALELSDVHE